MFKETVLYFMSDDLGNLLLVAFGFVFLLPFAIFFLSQKIHKEDEKRLKRS